MATDTRVTDVLNRAIARELAAIIQYMWNSVIVVGMVRESVSGVFASYAKEEMAHAEAYANRLDELGGTPTVTPGPVVLSRDLRKAIADAIVAEQQAIDLYAEAVDTCREVDDPVTQLLFTETLAAEISHHKTFTDLAM